MKTTKALGSLKAIFPPIHQPLPLNKHESQRLLDAIKASFRAQLDEEHGWASTGPTKPVLPAKPNFTYLPSNAAPSSAPQKRARPRPTDRHMHAILSHPLFSVAQTGKAAEAAEATDAPVNSWDAHKVMFEKAVSRGLMNVTRAHGFLMVVRSDVNRMATLSVLDGLKHTGAGLLVLQWLRSSGQERDLAFLRKTAFKRILLQFIVAENLDHVVWAWVERLMDPAVGPYPTAAATLIRDFIIAKADAPELEWAYGAMLEAEKLVKEKQLPQDILRLAWRNLATLTTMNDCDRKKPSVQVFDPFVAMGPAIGSRPLEMAHVNLHHPAEPSSDLAVEYLSTQVAWNSIRDPTVQTSTQARYADRLWWLGLDTVQHLMRVNETQEASRMWDLLEKNLGWLARAAPRLV